MNPKRKRRRTGRRHHRRRSYRRNPGGGILGDFKSVFPAVGYGVAGYVGMSVVPGFLSRFVPMPKKEENAAMYYATKLGVGIGLGWLAGRFISRHVGRQVLTGAMITVGAEVANQFALAPMGLSTYLPDSVADNGEMETYLPGSQPLGYLSPGVSVDDMGDEETLVTRLDPNRRF
jgi:hypothetical protein